jgi:hypothetical protein
MPSAGSLTSLNIRAFMLSDGPPTDPPFPGRPRQANRVWGSNPSRRPNLVPVAWAEGEPGGSCVRSSKCPGGDFAECRRKHKRCTAPGERGYRLAQARRDIRCSHNRCPVWRRALLLMHSDRAGSAATKDETLRMRDLHELSLMPCTPGGITTVGNVGFGGRGGRPPGDGTFVRCVRAIAGGTVFHAVSPWCRFALSSRQ